MSSIFWGEYPMMMTWHGFWDPTPSSGPWTLTFLARAFPWEYDMPLKWNDTPMLELHILDGSFTSLGNDGWWWWLGTALDEIWQLLPWWCHTLGWGCHPSTIFDDDVELERAPFDDEEPPLDEEMWLMGWDISLEPSIAPFHGETWLMWMASPFEAIFHVYSL